MIGDSNHERGMRKRVRVERGESKGARERKKEKADREEERDFGQRKGGEEEIDESERGRGENEDYNMGQLLIAP